MFQCFVFCLFIEIYYYLYFVMFYISYYCYLISLLVSFIFLVLLCLLSFTFFLLVSSCFLCQAPSFLFYITLFWHITYHSLLNLFHLGFPMLRSYLIFQMSTVFKEQVVPSWSRGGSTPSTPSSPYVGMPYSLNKSKNNSSSNLQVGGEF